MATGKKLPSWHIVLTRKKGERVGTLEAPSAEEAIKITIAMYGINDPERQRRLIAQRIERV